MTVPPKRASSRARKTRASHFALKLKKTGKCPKCQKPILAHTVCKNCGFYKGRDVLQLQSKLDKKAKKALKKDKKDKEPKK